MKIAVFYPDSRFCSWSMAWGLGKTLRRMGHEVIEGPMPTERRQIDGQNFERIKAKLPTIEQLKAQDLILTSGPEHVAPWLDAVYGQYEWKNLGVLKAGWYQESFFREDYKIDFDAMAPWSDEHFFPAVQDAEFHDQESFAKEHAHWLPFGVDTRVFRSGIEWQGSSRLEEVSEQEKKKSWPIGFVGLMYEKRQAFMRALAHHNMPPIRMGNVTVEDLGGWQAEESALRLANNYRRIGVFFNLPAMSALLVSKIYEVMACGTFLLTPMLSAERSSARNMEPFTSGEHLIFYRSSHLGYVAQLLNEWSSPENLAEREKIAAAGCAEVHAKHRLEQRLEAILEKCGAKVTVQ